MTIDVSHWHTINYTTTYHKSLVPIITPSWNRRNSFCDSEEQQHHHWKDGEAKGGAVLVLYVRRLSAYHLFLFHIYRLTNSTIHGYA
jgi:hypothetical protein